MTPLLQFAFRNLLTRPLRSLLSLIGLTVAIMAMVALFSVANGLNRIVHDTFDRIPGLLVVQPGAPIPLFSRLPAAWGDELAEIDGVAVVSPEVWGRTQLIEGTKVFNPPRFFFGADIASRVRLRHAVYRDSIIAGRYLTPDDKGTLNCVISQRIADEFGKQVGDTFRVDGNTLNIVGIYFCDSMFLDITIVLDIDEVRRISRTAADTVSAFYIEVQPGADSDDVIAAVQHHFRGRRLEAVDESQLLNMALGGQDPPTTPGEMLDKFLGALLSPPGQQPADPVPPPSAGDPTLAETFDELPLEIRSVADWANDLEEFSADLDIFIVIMTGIGVTIAVVSILNTMLMSVTERSIEFGILKANGWSRRDILLLVGLESGLLGIAGGISGSVFGWVATLVINSYWADRVYLYAGPGVLLFSVAFSTLLGIAGGLYPAYLAARMTPMNAIRQG